MRVKEGLGCSRFEAEALPPESEQDRLIRQTTQPTTYQDLSLDRGRLPMVHIALLDELRLRRGPHRCCTPVYAISLPQVSTKVKRKSKPQTLTQRRKGAEIFRLCFSIWVIGLFD